ncbi:MAG: amino acid-binding protein [Deltaproteobacteria bacterium]|jgi:glycine cleavage system transcriptional repressor|nr:amino acid-binding protein [Deltaproteobacteria bacterium]MBW2519245.1 amino acid-binding protein [Deltaproteobacteria bacterium]
MNHFALTIVGRDRPGIVSQVTEILYNLGCNIADSSCSILGGQFAMILIVAHPKFSNRDSFGDTFQPLEDADLTVALRVLKPGGEVRPEIEGDLCMISVYGADKPGIVYRVAKVLGEKNVNITDLNTKLVGTQERPVYVMVLEVTLPQGIMEEDLNRWLMPVRDELQVDISVRTIPRVEL